LIELFKLLSIQVKLPSLSWILFFAVCWILLKMTFSFVLLRTLKWISIIFNFFLQPSPAMIVVVGLSNVSVMGVVTYTQQYCWGTQQTVNGQYCPSTKPVPEDPSSERISERCHSGKHSEEPSSRRRRWASGRTSEYVPEGCVPKFFRKKGLSEYHFLLPEEGSSGSYFVSFLFFKLFNFNNKITL